MPPEVSRVSRVFTGSDCGPERVAGAWLLTSVILGVTAIHAVVALVIRSSMYSDSATGFLVLESMKRGASFNYLVSPSPADIAASSGRFLTWWSPGQYLVPGFFELFGADLGVAMVLTSAASSAIGALGWSHFYRSVGFSFNTVAITTLVIVTSRWFALPFGTYNGGEVLLFGVMPWAALLFWKLRSLSAASVPLLCGAVLLLTGAKLTGLICGLALLGACLFSDQNKPIFRKLVVAMGVAILCGAIFFVSWSSKGPTPGGVPGAALAVSPLSFAFPIAATVSSPVGLGDLLSWIFLHPSRRLLPSLDTVFVLLAPVAGWILIFVWRRLALVSQEYARFAFATSGFFSAAFLLVSARGSVSFEERHFRAVGLLVLVGFVHTFTNHPSKLVRRAFFALLLVLSTYGAGSAVSHAKHNLSSPIGVQGFRHGIATASMLDFASEVVEGAENAEELVVYVPSPEIGLEFRSARVIAGHADFESAEALRGRAFLGRVKFVYVFLQKRLVENGKARIILESFKDYDLQAWSEVDLGDFICFSQREADQSGSLSEIGL